MRVLLGPTRFQVNGTLIQENFYTAWVSLWNGDIVKRRKLRDFVDYEEDRLNELLVKGKPEESAKPRLYKKASWIRRFINWVTHVLLRG